MVRCAFLRDPYQVDLPPVAMIHKTLSVIWERALCIIASPALDFFVCNYSNE